MKPRTKTLIQLPMTYEPAYVKRLWDMTKGIEMKSVRGFYINDMRMALQPLHREESLAEWIVQREDGEDITRSMKIDAEPGDIKQWQRFIAGGNATTVFLQTVHTYLHIKMPDRAARLDPQRSADTAGRLLGTFLRDPLSYEAQYSLAVDGQRITGAYSYTDKGTIEAHDAISRCLVFVPGGTIGHLLCLDFCLGEWDIGVRKELLRFHYGFCVPGREFSPIIMQSHRERERVIGLLYTPNALLNFYSPNLDRLKIDMFVTDRSRIGGRASDDKDEVMLAALTVLHGPRLPINLSRVKDDILLNRLAEVVDRVRKDYL